MALPLPSVVANVGPGGPLVTSLQGINALRQSNAQAQYAPYTAYGDAAAKIAYANMLPYQIQAQILSNPMAWTAKDTSGMNAMLNNFSSTFPRGNNVFGNVQMPPPGQIGGIGNGLLGSLLNKIGIGGSSQPNNNTTVPQAPQNSMTQMPSSDQSSSNNAMTMGSPPSPQPLPGAGIPTNSYYQMKQTEASSAAQGTANVAQWKELNDATSNASVQAQDSLNDLNRFRTAYSNLKPYEKGVLFGELPHVSSEAQIADQAANSMRASLLRQLQQGHITNKDFDIGMTLKPSRTLNPDAEQAISNFMTGTAQRAQERVDFNNKALNMGLTSTQANLLWTKYINDRPFYDPQNKELIKENMNSWKPYLNKDKVASILSGNDSDQASGPSEGGQYVATSNSEPTSIQATSKVGNKEYQKINGKWYQK